MPISPEPLSGAYRIRTVSGPMRYMQHNVLDRKIVLRKLDAHNRYQRWNVTLVNEKTNTYKITGFGHKFNLTRSDQSSTNLPYLVGTEGNAIDWIIEQEFVGETTLARFCVTGMSNALVGFDEDSDTVCLSEKSLQNHGRQEWIFEIIDPPQTFRSRFFPLTLEDVVDQDYDIIIVGSGVGGGVLAHDLYDTNVALPENKAKKILLLERGDLAFHTHCLNSARSADLTADRGGHNDFFFHAFRGEYTFNPPVDPKDWKGGPMYSLGGRSAAWGLFVPRIHDRTLKEKFPPPVKDDLLREYYARAETLMRLSLPNTETFHRHIMDRLNMDGLKSLPRSRVQWNWGRVGSEFNHQRNFSFAEGGYSSIDKLFEIAAVASKDQAKHNRSEQQRSNFEIVLGTEVHSLFFHDGTSRKVAGVTVKKPNGELVRVRLNKQGGQVVLCAGSVNSPAILLRSQPDDSSWHDKIRKNHQGLRLTDHDIVVYVDSFKYNNPDDRARYGGMKLQTYFNMSEEDVASRTPSIANDAVPGDDDLSLHPTSRQGDKWLKDIALANASIDASSYLPWGMTPDSDDPIFIMAFILERELVAENDITIQADKPVVKMIRESPTEESKKRDETRKKAMAALTSSAIKTLETSLGAKFKDFDESRISTLPLGIVAHELGTLPMGGPNDTKACLDSDLRIHSDLCQGVYVCDLSCMPYSPEANPSLTLAALAIRLSRKLIPRDTLAEDVVTLVNRTGAFIKVQISNMAQVSDNQAHEAVIPPGKERTWRRKRGTPEVAIVYEQDPFHFDLLASEPFTVLAHPGIETSIF